VEPRTLSYVAGACAGTILSGSPERTVSRVGSDSRQAQASDLFVALRGERFDGHDFLDEAARKGIAAALVDRDRTAPLRLDCAVIAVENTRVALGRLAQRYRQDFQPAVVAVGGSNGKTTTKDLLATVLSQRFPTLSSEASFNNDLGVPFTLLNLERRHQAAVVEVGTNHPGELAPLVRLAQPRYGVIPSLGREHLEFFGDLSGVVAEEGWLAELLPADGKLYLHGDSPMVDEVTRRTRAGVVRVGFGESNDWRVRAAQLSGSGVRFDVAAPRAEFSGAYQVNLVGRHQVIHAVLAIAVGMELGLARAEIEEGLAAARPAKRRLELWEARGVRVLDDAYNANVDSMRVALETLRDLPCEGRRIAVLGDMAELGKESAAAHAEVGQCAAEVGVQQLFAVGATAAQIGRAARQAGLVRVLELPSAEVAADAVVRFVRPGDLVLVKASRASRLERVSEALRSAPPRE
jgi:UDP-N-acetylmuramoyl-tripeptide--D-alanyl-D-alanine ligase